jgi:hypothetical protein
MDVNDVLKKYSKEIEKQVNKDYLDRSGNLTKSSSSSKSYVQFKQDMMPELSKYESWVKNLGGFFKIKLSFKDEEKIKKELSTAHLDVEPGEVIGLAFFSLFIVLIVGLLISLAFWLIGYGFPSTLFFLFLVSSIFLFYYFYSMPSRLAIKWKLKASSQMVPAVLYAVIYMKHTSNLERAINFLSQHIEAPLALDFRKILWDVETGKYSSIKDSLDAYLDFWRDTNIEFVESFHLIESSLYEPSDLRRVQILERALQVILDGVYERMLKYTHSIKSPLTNIYMLGIVLPTLALALLPLASTLLQGAIKWTHVFIFFDLIIPFFVFYLTSQVMLSRPGGYGETSLLEKNPLYPKYKSNRPYYLAALICFPFFLLGLLPLIFGYTPIPGLFGLERDFSFGESGSSIFGDSLFGFMGPEGKLVYLSNSNVINGPFSVISTLLSLLIPFSIAMFFALSFSLKTKELIKARDDTKELEKEFNSSLFTLGNRIGDGTPAEIAFGKVAESLKGQKTENFFRIVSTNIQSMGMSLDEAIFNQKRGALVYYPSNLIATIMRILTESVKKGLEVAAQSLMSISQYVSNLNKINERLNDLLTEVISDMKNNMNFLAPLLAGIIVGLAGMITSILIKLRVMMSVEGADSSAAGLGNLGNFAQMFDPTFMIPPYFMQLAIGIYIVEMIFILTATLVIIKSGEDKLKQTYDTSKNLLKGAIVYLITALVSIVALSLLANIALGGMGG